ncbi:MAG: type II secretion system F family protein [Deltaproteobacteria bacterium]|nr:type II secretion system F family protein [Deltaproteobacteria bacterium]
MTTQLLGMAAIVLLAAGLFFFVYGEIGLQDSRVNRLLSAYLSGLDHHLKFIRSKKSARNVFVLQLIASGLVGLFTVYYPLGFLLIPIVLLAPVMQLKNLRDKRVIRLESQLDSWLLVLANALKAVPSIGEALISSRALAHAPISEEIDVAIKENQLGAPLDEALKNMANRIESRVVAAALTTLSIARKTGGDLPATLEASAAALREMARLEGVIRTKTADGRNQAFVLGSLPAVLIVALYFAYPVLLEKLFNTSMGHVLLGVAIALWIGAVVVAMNILKVDI